MTTSDQTAIGINEVLATSFVNPRQPPPATLENTALLLIDIQHLAEPSYHLSNAVAAGLSEDAAKAALSDYEVRFSHAVVQAAHVLDAARSAGIPPIHVKIQALSCRGRDTSQLHSRLGWNFPPGSPATRFLEPTKPRPDEIVITKTASGAFTGTSLDTTLRNMGIEHLIIVGFMTDECVETTTRVALDYGYVARVVSDATTTYHLESYQSTIGKLASYGFTLTADEAIAEMKNMSAQA
jgi:nicotinamidase-related amidase